MNMWQCTIFLVFFGKLLQTSALIFAYSRTKRAPSRIKKNPQKYHSKMCEENMYLLVSEAMPRVKKNVLDIMVDLWCNVVIMIDS